jgi:GxxExxY protein
LSGIGGDIISPTVLKREINRSERRGRSGYVQIMTENEIGTLILDAAFEVHRALGPGLLESSYEHCLAYELVSMGLNVAIQKPLPLVYKETKLDCGYRIDLLVEDKVVIELKTVEAINDIHLAQVLTYLNLSGCKLGYILNFNVVQMKSGIRRVVHNLLKV